MAEPSAQACYPSPKAGDGEEHGKVQAHLRWKQHKEYPWGRVARSPNAVPQWDEPQNQLSALLKVLLSPSIQSSQKEGLRVVGVGLGGVI